MGILKENLIILLMFILDVVTIYNLFHDRTQCETAKLP